MICFFDKEENMSSREREEEERRKEARRRYLRGEIRARQEKIRRLNGYKNEYIKESNNIISEVIEPENGYDLTVAVDMIHWSGKLQEEGEEKKKSLISKGNGYIGEIHDVTVKIDGVITRLQHEIESLQRELAAV